LRQRHGLIVKGKRISCPPHYAPPNNDYDRLGLMRSFLFHALRFFEIPRVLMRFNHVA
jgi:hypothetical protein